MKLMCFACVAAVSIAVPASAELEPVFALDVSIAPTAEGAPIRSEDWVYERLDLAERVLSSIKVHFHIWHWRTVGRELARIEDPRERDRFAPPVAPTEINVFVVERLRDNEVKDLYRMGVTWDSHTTPSARFIILSADCVRSSLAHELGHFPGIQPHSFVKNNLMGYDRDDALVFLDPSQQTLVIARAHTLRTSGALFTFGWFVGSNH